MSESTSPTRSGRLIVDPKLCHACQSCMVACSLSHEGQVIPSKARLQVTVDPFRGNHTIRYCRQCRKAPCAEACPQHAIVRREAGYWELDAALCEGCGKCVTACPFHTLAVVGVALKCDTCHGNPACAASCSSGAIVWRTESK
ncbi:MAG: 4Fe-4S dicluster domain-containing protein [Chloroflexi bacterium]|jgi:Fe-S-cluster-containing hydrogenase component 2|nr:4Fe-4S dicluster domain-containing protein [Chloroflexota bacterium]